MTLFECPICCWKGNEFLPKHVRKSVLCPKCGSFERHRHQFIVYRKLGLPKIIKGIRVLHISPEKCIANVLNNAGLYVSLDLAVGKAQIISDITKLPFTKNSFELVWASHVLEHVRKVGLAISEIKRVLVSNGIALLDVPIYGNTTIKFKKAGHHGHIWAPGYDWYKRYKKAGFTLRIFGPEICKEQYGVKANSSIVICEKR